MPEEVTDRRLDDLKTGSLRTAVPFVVGLLTSLAARNGLDVDDPTINSLIGLAGGFVYYLIARVLELFKNSKWGKLLGSAKTPVYAELPAEVTDASGQTTVTEAPEDEVLDSEPDPVENDAVPEQTDNTPREVDGPQDISQDPTIEYESEA